MSDAVMCLGFLWPSKADLNQGHTMLLRTALGARRSFAL